MPAYIVSYMLQGEMKVKADNESDAKDLVKGIITEEHAPILDSDLIKDIEGYGDRTKTEGYTIEGDAIHITDVQLEEK